jgi:hypothetical protein
MLNLRTGKILAFDNRLLAGVTSPLQTSQLSPECEVSANKGARQSAWKKWHFGNVATKDINKGGLSGGNHTRGNRS